MSFLLLIFTFRDFHHDCAFHALLEKLTAILVNTCNITCGMISVCRAAATASRRIGEPEDLAGPALFLASDLAAYVNGAEVLVDGGLDCMLMDMVPRPGFNATPAA